MACARGSRSKEKNFEEDERLGPPLWDSRDRGWRDGKGSFTDRDANRFGVEEDRWVPGGGSRGYPPNRFEGRPSLDSRAYADADYVGIGTSALDDSLLYPPFVRPAPPPSNDDQADKVAEAQENKKQFELFLDEYAEKLSKVSTVWASLVFNSVLPGQDVFVRSYGCSALCTDCNMPLESPIVDARTHAVASCLLLSLIAGRSCPRPSSWSSPLANEAFGMFE